MPGEAAVLRDYYYRLASEIPGERISAAGGLISDLQRVNDETEWNYALDRLLKGLSTTRQSARFGFSMALAELLRELILSKFITGVGFFNRIVESTQVKSSMKGKDERAILFGRLFGLQALLNSGYITSEEASIREKQTFVTLLVELSTTKPWLRETAIFTLCSFIKQLRLVGHFDAEFVRSVFLSFDEQGLTLTSEGLAVYLSIPSEFRSVSQEVVRGSASWKNGDPLSKGNLPVLSRTLKEVEVAIADVQDEPLGKKAQQKSSWTQRLPFVWDLVLDELTNLTPNDTESPKSKKRSSGTSKNSSKKRKHEDQAISSPTRISLAEFWSVVVDEAFFSEKSSHERKYWGFEIFGKFVANVNADDLPILFSPNFMRCLINQSAQSNRLLHKMAKKLLDCITSVAKDLFKAPAILSSLLNEANGGGWNFDVITKTKLVDTLLSSASHTDDLLSADRFTNEVKDILNAQFDNASANDDPELLKRTESRQKWVLDKFLLLVRSSKKSFSSQNLLGDSILKILVRYAFFNAKEGPALSNTVQKVAQERLSSILSEFISIPREEGSWPLVCVKHIHKSQSSSKYIVAAELEGELSNVAERCYSKVQGLVIQKKDGQLECLELMFSMVYIQLFMGDAEAVSTYEDLLTFSDKLSGSATDSTPAVLITEIVLSLVSRRSSLLKKLSLMIWDAFLCTADRNGQILTDVTSLNLLYDIITAKENKEGQRQLFEGEEEYGIDGDDENENNEEESEDEEIEDEDTNLEVENEEDGADVSELDKATTKKLAAALGIETDASGEVKFSDLSDDSDDSEEGYESMNDEQMMEMDDQLSKIFKERKDALDNVTTGNKRKAEVIEAKEQMVFFKNRVLDLLELFVRKQPDSSLLLTMIEPLLILIGLTMDNALSAKAHKLMKNKFNRIKITDFTKLDTVGQNIENYLLKLLRKVHSIASKSKVKAQSLACNQAGLIIAKELVSIDEENIDTIIDMYSESLKVWAKEPKNKIQASMFFDFINWLNSKRG